MRHNKWNKYLKIACSWILIFSMCFLSMNTVNASAEDTTAFESESETGDTEAFTSDTEISDTEIESEPSTDQFTSENEETKQETEKQIQDSIEVAQLNAEIQNRVVNGEVPSTDRVEYVDEKGKIIEGAPTTIELGTIADHKDLAITGKNYEFKSARVNGKDCVYIGKYNDTVYYSTDGVIAIKLDDGGPVFFSQTRIGLHGRPFKMYKFRSMVTNAEELKKKLAEENGQSDRFIFKMKDDPRITKIGHFIRKTSLDEFPQFFNVLKGDMSLVGPRPALPEEVARYGSLYSARLLVKPGITGPWQVSGRSDLSQEQSEYLDVSYIENWSITGDLAILAKTVLVVFRGTGSY